MGAVPLMRERLYVLFFVITVAVALYGIFMFMPSPDMPPVAYFSLGR